MVESSGNLWDRVDCGGLSGVIEAVGPRRRLGSLSQDEKEAIFPGMIPTDSQIAEANYFRGKPGGTILGAASLPSTYLPRELSIKTLGKLHEENCSD